MGLPEDVADLIAEIERAGFLCYAVGGCVRDLLRGVEPTDFDLCTSALPQQLLPLFPENTVIPSGIAHGTVTVLWRQKSCEITTFRSDGTYLDSRHPQSVTFVPTLGQDLARRDFTVNAMALHPEKGLIDPYGGKADLKNGVLRCVGVPQKRFAEDALRILRGIRFCAALSLVPQAQTRNALFSEKERLRAVSAERCAAELCKTLCAPAGIAILSEYLLIFRVRYPQMEAPAAWKGQPSLACALALCFPHGLPPHAALPLPKRLLRKAEALCAIHAAVFRGEADAAQLCYRFGEETVKEALAPCTSPAAQTTLHALFSLLCPSRAQLALSARELLAMGLRGAEIGQALQAAYLAVNRGLVKNTPSSLRDFCQKH